MVVESAEIAVESSAQPWSWPFTSFPKEQNDSVVVDSVSPVVVQDKLDVQL